MRKASLIVLALGAAVASNAALLYSNTTQTGSRLVGLGAGEIAFDDILVPAVRNPGNQPMRITSVTVGIRQVGGAPATGVELFYANVNNAVGTNAPTIDGVTMFHTDNLTAKAASVTSLVTATNPNGLFTVYPNGSLIANNSAFAIGVRLSDTTSNLNGWRVTNGPDPNIDAFWVWDSPGPGNQGFFNFGGPPQPSATFYVSVEGTPVPEPASMAAIALGFAGVAARRRRTKK